MLTFMSIAMCNQPLTKFVNRVCYSKFNYKVPMIEVESKLEDRSLK